MKETTKMLLLLLILILLICSIVLYNNKDKVFSKESEDTNGVTTESVQDINEVGYTSELVDSADFSATFNENTIEEFVNTLTLNDVSTDDSTVVE